MTLNDNGSLSESMSNAIHLTVVTGRLAGRRLELDERTTLLVGRAADCGLQLPDDDAHSTVSRHHCLLDVNPPAVRVRDFGSLNGTFVNGELIGRRSGGDPEPEPAARERDLADGDEVRVGGTVLKVDVVRAVRCVECRREIPEDARGAARISGEVYRCERCRAPVAPPPKPAAAPVRPAAAPVRPLVQKAKKCAACGGPTRGDVLCPLCQRDPDRVLALLLDAARAGRPEVAPIQGYTVLEELGRGGMGAVYLARHDASGRQVALKLMLPQVAADPTALERFLREAELTRALDHPHIVRLYDVGCADGSFFFTLEVCRGGSVGDLMKKRNAPLAVDEAVRYALQLAKGLEYAHQAVIPRPAGVPGPPVQGVVHRDLKPGNFFLTGDPRRPDAKIGDYGLAKAFDLAGLSGHTMTGTAAGTPVFMPRQQVVNFKYARPEVDVWALAASLYVMLCGAPPRDFTPGRDPWRTVLETRPVPLLVRDPRLPRRLAEAVDAALVDEPAIAVTSARELRRSLESAL